MHAATPSPELLAELTSAVASGRLTLAELLGLSAAELQALLGAACARLHTGRDAAAVDLLAALVALFPYAASFWRAYGVALHRTRALIQARAAYEAALLLEPEHALTRCYLAEVRCLKGEQEAMADLEPLTQHMDKRAAERAALLLQLLTPAPAPPPPEPEAPPEAAVTEQFCLPDGRTLPLVPNPFAAGTGVQQDLDMSFASPPTRREVTDTAVVDRHVRRVNMSRPNTVTARLPRAWPTALERRHAGPPLSSDITLTDIKKP